MSLTAEPFGALPDGSPVIRHTLSRTGGLTLRVLTYGGIVQSLEVPDARARVTNVVLGFASLDGYLKASDAYFGGLVGRFADRLAGGRFTLGYLRWSEACGPASYLPNLSPIATRVAGERGIRGAGRAVVTVRARDTAGCHRPSPCQGRSSSLTSG